MHEFRSFVDQTYHSYDVNTVALAAAAGSVVADYMTAIADKFFVAGNLAVAVADAVADTVAVVGTAAAVGSLDTAAAVVDNIVLDIVGIAAPVAAFELICCGAD